MLKFCIIFSQGELSENPDAVLHAVKFFMFSQKQTPTTLPFKVLATNEVIEKESMEIESMGMFISYNSLIYAQI